MAVMGLLTFVGGARSGKGRGLLLGAFAPTFTNRLHTKLMSH